VNDSIPSFHDWIVHRQLRLIERQLERAGKPKVEEHYSSIPSAN